MERLSYNWVPSWVLPWMKQILKWHWATPGETIRPLVLHKKNPSHKNGINLNKLNPWWSDILFPFNKGQNSMNCWPKGKTIIHGIPKTLMIFWPLPKVEDGVFLPLRSWWCKWYFEYMPGDSSRDLLIPLFWGPFLVSKQEGKRCFHRRGRWILRVILWWCHGISWFSYGFPWMYLDRKLPVLFV